MTKKQKQALMAAWGEHCKLRAEGDKLRYEASRVFEDAVRDTMGDGTDIVWTVSGYCVTGCRVDGVRFKESRR
jgi:hypothetical protein